MFHKADAMFGRIGKIRTLERRDFLNAIMACRRGASIEEVQLFGANPCHTMSALPRVPLEPKGPFLFDVRTSRCIKCSGHASKDDSVESIEPRASYLCESLCL